MSLALILLPFDYDGGNSAYSHTVLLCYSTPLLFDEIQEQLQGIRVPEDFSTYLSKDNEDKEPRYGNTQETDYGEPLTYVLVEQLLPFSSHEKVRAYFQNRAVWAYLAELPPRTKVALYWQ